MGKRDKYILEMDGEKKQWDKNMWEKGLDVDHDT